MSNSIKINDNSSVEENVIVERLENNQIKITRTIGNDETITIVYVITGEDIDFIDEVKERIRKEEQDSAQIPA